MLLARTGGGALLGECRARSGPAWSARTGCRSASRAPGCPSRPRSARWNSRSVATSASMVGVVPERLEHAAQLPRSSSSVIRCAAMRGRGRFEDAAHLQELQHRVVAVEVDDERSAPSSSSSGRRLVTYVPSPWRTSSTRISDSARTASRSELRDSPSRSARSASLGRRSPGRSCPGDDHFLDALDRLVGNGHAGRDRGARPKCGLRIRLDRHNFGEVVPSSPPGGHNFPEVVTIKAGQRRSRGSAGVGLGRRAAGRQEVEVAALVGLRDVLQVQRAVAAGVLRRRLLSTPPGARPARRRRPPGSAGAPARRARSRRRRAPGRAGRRRATPARRAARRRRSWCRSSARRRCAPCRARPCRSSFFGIGSLPHSGMPGAPCGPALGSTSTESSSTSRSGSSMRAARSS